MEDYDPTTFHRTTADALAAWALVTLLFAGILVGSSIVSSTDFDEQTVPLTLEKNAHDSLRANIPEPKTTTRYHLQRN